MKTKQNFGTWKQEQWHRQDRMARIFSRISEMNEDDGRSIFYLLTTITEKGVPYKAIADQLCALVPDEVFCANRKGAQMNVAQCHR